jgi:hypothetical protein
MCDAAPILVYNAVNRCSISVSDRPSELANWAVDRPAASD